MMNTDPELSKMLKAPYLNYMDMQKLIKKYKMARDKDKKLKYRNQILDNNIRFIRKIVVRSLKNNTDRVEDVFNSAIISFFDGLDAYKLQRKVAFTTYIYYWIMRAVYENYSADNVVHIPGGVFFKKTQESISASNSSLIYLDKSIHYTNGDDPGGETFRNLIIDKRNEFPEEDYLLKLSIKEIKDSAEVCLGDRERTVIYLRYLFDECLTFQEIGDFLDIYGERVRQIEANAIRKLRYNLKLDERGSVSQANDNFTRKIDYQEIRSFYENTIKSRNLSEDSENEIL